MMAPDSHDTPDPAAILSPESFALLRNAITSRWRDAEVGEPQLVTALAHVAAEARSRGVRPESLIIVLKRLADEIGIPADAARRLTANDQRRLRDWIVTASLKAYFS